MCAGNPYRAARPAGDRRGTARGRRPSPVGGIAALAASVPYEPPAKMPGDGALTVAPAACHRPAGTDGTGAPTPEREPVSYCRVVNAVRVAVARHCRAHRATRLAVLWTAVPTLEGLGRLGMKERTIAECFAACEGLGGPACRAEMRVRI